MAFSLRILKNARKKLLIRVPALGKKIMARFRSKKAQNGTLPVNLIIEILSRLPLKNLSRVQLVCKEWQALTNDHHFIQMHMARSHVLSYSHNVSDSTTDNDDHKKESLRFMHGCDGVVIILNKTSNKYILWNPAISRALDLPDPQAGTVGLALLYLPATRDYKIVSIYYKDRKSGVGCEVLNLNGPSLSWKSLAFPDVEKPKNVLVIATGREVHCVVATKDDGGDDRRRMIVTLDVETESFTVNSPGDVFFDLSTSLLNWDGKLGVVNIVGKNLELIKLEDYKKHKWSVEKTVIPLPFMNKPGFEGTVRPLFSWRGDVWFWIKGKDIFYLNIGTGKTFHVKSLKALNCKGKQIYLYKRSLLSFKGMRPDTETSLWTH